jgi:hypothetical protein
MSQQSPIFVKTEVFMLWLFNHTTKFPKHERFRLAKRLDDSVFGFHEAILRAAQGDKLYLREAEIQLNQCRAYLRLALGSKYTTPKQHEYAAGHTTELGKLLGGWMKKA